MTKKTEEMQICSWCGQEGLTNFMYLEGGLHDWYHVNCLIKNSKYTNEFIFGAEKE